MTKAKDIPDVEDEAEDEPEADEPEAIPEADEPLPAPTSNDVGAVSYTHLRAHET